MGIRKSVFGSRSERTNYEHLCRIWGDSYRVYHNLPFLNIFDTSELYDFSEWSLRPVALDDVDRSRLKKTSVDFTLCGDRDAPILCIEFDGMYDGFNVGTRYLSNRPSTPWRETIMGLKLRVAHGSLFPFVVVGAPQFETIAADAQLAIVDGIIGKIMATKARSDKDRARV